MCKNRSDFEAHFFFKLLIELRLALNLEIEETSLFDQGFGHNQVA